MFEVEFEFCPSTDDDDVSLLGCTVFMCFFKSFFVSNLNVQESHLNSSLLLLLDENAREEVLLEEDEEEDMVFLLLLLLLLLLMSKLDSVEELLFSSYFRLLLLLLLSVVDEDEMDMGERDDETVCCKSGCKYVLNKSS